jgi:hypothetical protein
MASLRHGITISHPPRPSCASLARFLHTADWQIGRQFAQFPPEDGAALAEARIAAVATLAQLATTHGVDAVLVAGDAFDVQNVAGRTLRQLMSALAAYGGPWVVIPGNHDAALAEGVWAQAARAGLLPPNLQLMSTPGIADFPDAGFSVLAAPLTQRQTHEDLTAWFDGAATLPGRLRIGLAHGSVQGILADEVDSPNPIAADRAMSARLDYLALGDWHGCRRIDDRTWYSGTPEPDRFKGNEPGHALLVDVPQPGAVPTVTRLATARFTWTAWEARLEVASDVDMVAGRLASAGAEDVLSVALSGRVDLPGMTRLRDALAGAEAAARSLVQDLGDLRLLPTDEDIATLAADGYVGEVITALRARQEAGAGDAGLAAEALGLLAGMLADAHARKGQA